MKIIARIIIIIFIFFVGFFAGRQYSPESAETNGLCLSPALTVAEAEPVRLMIDYGNGQLDAYSMDLSEDTSVFQLLQSATDEKKVELKYKDYGGDMGIFVEAIGGVENNMGDNEFWQYWINNNYAQVGPGQHILKPGDQVQWKFIKGQFNE